MVVNDGLFKGSSELSDLILDGLKSLWAEGGGKLDEGKDGVLSTDSAELGEDGISVAFGLDGAKLGGDDVEGLNNLRGGELSLFESLVVSGSGVSEDLLLFVQDVELDGGVLDGGFELGDLVGKALNLVAGFSDLVG